MPTALILGASRGIGHEFVRKLLAKRWRVIATARSDDALSELKQIGAEAFKLDVAKPDSLAGLGWQLDGEKLDLAIYVAGVMGPRSGATAAPTEQEFDQVMHTNVLGAMQAIPLLAPLVEAANGKFVFLGSVMGSIASTESSYGWLYRVSKSGLNMAVRCATFDYPKATFAVVHPGWVQTDMGGPSAAIKVEDSVGGLLRVIDGLKPGESGSYHDYSGRALPW